MSISGDEFREAMARFPGVVTIVTTLDKEERRGITASAVSSVSADPPSVLACLNQSTGTCAAVEASGRFNINLLAQSEQDLALTFAGVGGLTGEQKFLMEDGWQADEFGLPYLNRALVSLSCKLTQRFVSGSHAICVGTIDAARFGAGQPLLYERGAFRALAAG